MAIEQRSYSSGTPGRFDVLLSYNRKDRAQAEQLGLALRKRELSVWLDLWDVPPGRSWLRELENIIGTVKTAAVLVGKNGQGPWQTLEIDALLQQCVKRGMPMIPVLLPQAPEQPELPIFLAGYNWVDLRDGLQKVGLDLLEWGITGMRPEPAPGQGGDARRTREEPILEHSWTTPGNRGSVHEAPFALMLRRLIEVWKPKLSSERIGSLDLGEAAEVLLRVTVSRMKPAWLDLLGKYERYPHLRSGLDEDEKYALRKLRNLGVGRHDGRSLFTPSPSSKFEPTDAGAFLLRLYHGDPPDAELLRAYFKQMMTVARHGANREILEKICREGRFPRQRRDKVRELRRMGLVEHESDYLATTDRATLTALGLHVLNRLGKPSRQDELL